MTNLEKQILKVLVFDTETTGVSEVDDIIEFSANLEFPENELVVYTTKIKPRCEISPIASSVHFITYEDVESEPEFDGFVDDIIGLFEAKEYYVGHNVNFDRDMMVSAFFRYNNEVVPELFLDDSRWLDTYKLARKLYSQDKTVENLKLGYLWFRFGINKTCNRKIVPHAAEDDVFMCKEVLKFLITECIKLGYVQDDENLIANVIAFSHEPIEYLEMPWGKHKGTKICDLDISYINWLITKSDVLDNTKNTYDADLAHTIEVEYAKRMA